EVNGLAKEWFPDKNRVVVVRALERAGLAVPDQAKLTAVMKSAAGMKDLKAYVDTMAAAALLEATPKSGSVVKTSTKETSGITEWELSNGAKVVLKPTNFKNDEVVFRAFKFGGTSLVSDKDYIPASTATQIVTSGGLGKFSATDLRKVMTGKVAAAS